MGCQFKKLIKGNIRFPKIDKFKNLRRVCIRNEGLPFGLKKIGNGYAIQ